MTNAKSGIVQKDLLENYYSEHDFPIDPRTARNYRARNEGPPWVKLFGKIYYPKDEFQKWVKSQVRQPSPRRRRYG
jgi:hypothetical protein